MRRVILHLGFHKTGSSSVQELLRANRDRLAPRIACLIRKDPELRGLEAACKAFDRAPNLLTRARLRRQWRRLTGRLEDAAAETVIVSSEDLMGRIPSERDAAAIYSNSATIIGTLQGATPEVELHAVFYTRDGAAWRDSLYRHLVRTRSLGMSPEAFAALEKFRAPDDALRQAAERVGAEVRGGLSLLCFEDDLDTRLGPGTALLTLAGVSAAELAALRPVAQQNVGIDAHRVAEIRKTAPDWLPKPLRRAVVRLRSR